MSKMIKKCWSWLLVTLLAFTGASALATPVAKVGNAEYETIAEAFNVAKDGETVTLLADSNTKFETKTEADASPAPDFEGKSLTLDLNGFKLGANTAYCFLGDNAGLTVKDSSAAKTGALVPVSGAYAPWLVPAAYGGIHVYGKNVTVNLESGTYTYSVGDTDANMGALIGFNAGNIGATEEANAKITISGGTFVSDEKGSHKNCVVTTYGKKVDIVVTGGTFLPTGKDTTAYFNVRGGESSLKISGGDFQGKNPLQQSTLQSTSKVEVSGGTFANDVPYDYLVYGAGKTYDETTGKWTVTPPPPVVAIDGTPFEGRLAEAFKAAKDGAVLTLLADANTKFETMKENDESPSPYWTNKSVTLDLNGFKLGVSMVYERPCYFLLGDGAGLTIKDSSAAKTGALVRTTGARAGWLVAAPGGGILVYGKNVTINLEGGSYVYSHADTDSNMGPLIGVDLYDGKSTTTEMNAKVNISGGTFVSDEKGSHKNCVVTTYGKKVDVSVTGGTFLPTGKDTTAFFNVRGGDSTVKISGGDFQGASPIQQDTLAGTSKIEVSGGTFGVKPLNDYLVAGYQPVQNEDGSWTTRQGVAEVNGKPFMTFEDAISFSKTNENAQITVLDNTAKVPADWRKKDGVLVERTYVATLTPTDGEPMNLELPLSLHEDLQLADGDTIKLTKDVSVTAEFAPPADATVTFDLNGYTLTGNVALGTGAAGTLVVKDSDTEEKGKVVGNLVANVGTGVLQVESGKYDVTYAESGSADLTLKGGTFYKDPEGYVHPDCKKIKKGETWIVGIIVNTGDNEKDNKASTLIKPQTYTVDESEVNKQVGEEKVEIGGEEVRVAEKILQNTKVEGVKLTVTETVPVLDDQGEVTGWVSGVQAAVDAAKAQAAAVLDPESGATDEARAAAQAFADNISTTEVVTVKVVVNASLPEYVADYDDDGPMAVFSLDPTATVTVEDASGTHSTVVEATNDMIDKENPISVVLFTGTRPAVIIHTADASEGGGVIETFKGDQITYDPTTGNSTIKISHFSHALTLPVEPKVMIGDTPYNSLEEAMQSLYDGDHTGSVVQTISILTNLTGSISAWNISDYDLVFDAPTNVTVTLTSGGITTFAMDIPGSGSITFTDKITWLDCTNVSVTASAADIEFYGEAEFNAILAQNIYVDSKAAVTCTSYVGLNENEWHLGQNSLVKAGAFKAKKPNGKIDIYLHPESGYNVAVAECTSESETMTTETQFGKSVTLFNNGTLVGDVYDPESYTNYYRTVVANNSLYVQRIEALVVGGAEYNTFAAAYAVATNTADNVSIKLTAPDVAVVVLPASNVTVVGLKYAGGLPATTVNAIGNTLSGTIKNCIFENALTGASFADGTIENCTFKGALTGCTFVGCTFKNCRFEGTDGIVNGICSGDVTFDGCEFATKNVGVCLAGAGNVTFRNDCTMVGVNEFAKDVNVVFDHSTFAGIADNPNAVCQTYGNMTLTNGVVVSTNWIAKSGSFIGNAAADTLTSVFGATVEGGVTNIFAVLGDSRNFGIVAVDPGVDNGYTNGWFRGEEVNVADRLNTSKKPVAYTGHDDWYVAEDKDNVWTDWAPYAYAQPVDEQNKIVTITSAADFAHFAKLTIAGTNYDGYTVKLAADLNLSAHVWVPTGTFKGVFDGRNQSENRNYTISGLVVTGFVSTAEHTYADPNHLVVNNAGLFGATVGATIRDVSINGATIVATGNKVGALVGTAEATLVSGVTVANASVTGAQEVGGLIGYGKNVSVVNCTATENTSEATITIAGGLAGTLEFAGSTTLYVSTNSIAGTAKSTGIAGGLAGQIKGSTGAYDIRRNEIAVSLTAATKSPIGWLADGQDSAFTSVMTNNITVNWWELSCYDAETYTYLTDQTICRGVAGVVDGDSRWGYKSLAGAVAAVTNGQTVVVYADNDDTVANAPSATFFTFDSLGFNVQGGGISVAHGYKFVKNDDNTCTYRAVDDPLLVDASLASSYTAGQRVSGTDYVYGYDAFSMLKPDVAQWLWNGKSVFIQGGTVGGSASADGDITLTNGTYGVTGSSSEFVVNGLVADNATLLVTNATVNAYKFGATNVNGKVLIADSTIEFVKQDDGDQISYLYASAGGQLTITNLVQKPDSGDYGCVRLTATGSGTAVKVYDSTLNVWEGSGVTGGATLSLFNAGLVAPDFTLDTGSTLNVDDSDVSVATFTNGGAVNVTGTSKLSSTAFTKSLNLGSADKETTLTTDGLNQSDGDVLIADGSTVTLSGDGFAFENNAESGTLFYDAAAKYNDVAHQGFTLNIADADSFSTYGIYANTGSVVNVSNVTNLNAKYFNVYGGTLNVTGTDRTNCVTYAHTKLQSTSGVNVREATVDASYLELLSRTFREAGSFIYG